MRVLDYLKTDEGEASPHPLQELVEEFVDTQLTDDEKEVFYMRYGEQLPIREIARRQGYTSHQIIQVKMQRIEDKCERWLNDRDRSTDQDNN